MSAPETVLAISSGAGVSSTEIEQLTADALAGLPSSERRFLVVVPDSSRKLPLASSFAAVWDALRGRAERVDALIAQGTHRPMGREAKDRWVFGDRSFPNTEIFDHPWDDDRALADIGVVPLDDQLERFGEHRDGARLLGFDADMPIRINRRLLDYDRVILLTRVQPHEGAGFAGGAKQIFPGVSGPEMINLLHAIGGLQTNRGIHGVLPNPVRDLIDDMTVSVPVPIATVAMVLDDATDAVRGYFVQPDGWRTAGLEAARLSSEVNVRYLPQRVSRLIAAAPQRADGSWLYPELWTGSKGISKTEDAVRDGGELILWAPNIRETSETHGALIRRVGFHAWPYLFANPDAWRAAPTPALPLTLSVIVKGDARLESGREIPRIHVRLATAIPKDECHELNIGYEDPDAVAEEIEAATPNEVDDDRLLVTGAGSVLWRHRDDP